MGNNTRQTVAKYNFRFTKSLGQNFLVDDTVVEDIIRGSEIDSEDDILEIGPGIGTLTKELLRCAGHVTAIEIDSELIPILNEELKDFPNFTLIHNDVLNLDLKELLKGKKVKVVANLPYYVTTPILIKLLEEGADYTSITVMIQKEVAERLNAVPGTKDYGALTLLVQYHTETEIIRTVHPESFVPRPKVDSTVIRLKKRERPPVETEDLDYMLKVIRTAFAMRRKTLINNLKQLGYSSEVIEGAMDEAGIDLKRRGETLDLKEFAALSSALRRRI